MKKTPTKGQPNLDTDNGPAVPPAARATEAAADSELAERVVTEVERLTAYQRKPDRLKLWLRVADYRDWLCRMVEQWDDMGQRKVADQCRERLRKLDSEIGDKEPSLKKLRAIVGAQRIAIRDQAHDMVLTYLCNRIGDADEREVAEHARQIAEPLLGQLRGCRYPLDIEGERTKVLAAIARGEGNTSGLNKNIARRMVRGLY